MKYLILFSHKRTQNLPHKNKIITFAIEGIEIQCQVHFKKRIDLTRKIVIKSQFFNFKTKEIMTIDPQIQQLNRQDFIAYLHQLQILAREKYSFDIFIKNRLSQINEFEEYTNKRTLGLWKNKIGNISSDFNEPLEELSDYM